MVTNKIKKIDGHDCSMNSLGFFEQMRLKRELITPIVKIIPELLAGGMDSELDFSKVSGLLDVLDADSQEKFTRIVFKNLVMDGNDMSDDNMADTMMSAKTVTFYKIIWFFLEVNYSDFLELIRTTLEKYGVTKASMTEKLKTSSQTMKKSSKKS